jgi:hypothetical protein
MRRRGRKDARIVAQEIEFCAENAILVLFEGGNEKKAVA